MLNSYYGFSNGDTRDTELQISLFLVSAWGHPNITMLTEAQLNRQLDLLETAMKSRSFEFSFGNAFIRFLSLGEEGVYI